MTGDDLKFILSLDIDEAQKELKILEQQAGKTFDPMLAAGRKLAAEMKANRDAERADQAEAIASQLRTPKPFFDMKGLGKAGSAVGMVGAAATAASSGMSGGQLANISGGIAGMFHPEAAAIGAAVGGIAGLIEAPFVLMARQAQNAARALGELEGPLGVVGVGMEKTAQNMEYIPVIGQHLAATERASKQMAEQNMRFMSKLSPAFSEMMQTIKDDIEALKPDREGAAKVKRQNEFYRDTLGSSGDNPSTLKRQIEENFNSGGTAEERMNRALQLKRQLEFQEAAEAGKKEYNQGGFIGPKKKVDAATYKEIFGKDFVPGAGFGAAAKPAQFSSFADYERQMQQKAFSQGVDPQETRYHGLLSVLNDINKNVKGGRPGRADAAVDGARDAGLGGFGDVVNRWFPRG